MIDRDIRYLDQDQVRALFAVISAPRDRLLFGMIYRFGMRVSEACELPARALDRERWTIVVQGKKHGLRRTYIVPEDLRQLARKWHGRDGWMFHGREGRLSRCRVWQLFKAYARVAGLPPDLGVHCLRHSAAVHALDAGLSTEDVRDLLRHRRIATTDIYANLSTRRRNDYLARLEASAEVVKLEEIA